MAIAETPHSATDAHHDSHHDHGEFIAHHFDSAEQQYDSGKLGIWLFLVTEILFFSGLFVAYTLFRSHQPEIFEQAHFFLNKYLGGLNTLVLLFSSLTMALGVRAAQLGRNGEVAGYTLITMVCAAMFIGVKAVEYSHKWDMGIWVRSAFQLQLGHHEAPEGTLAHALGISQYLVWLSLIPAILLVGFLGLSLFFKMTNSDFLFKFFGGMFITVGGYFLGVVVGHYFMMFFDTGASEGADHASSRPIVLYALQDVDGSNSNAGLKVNDEISEQIELQVSEATASQGHSDSNADLDMSVAVIEESAANDLGPEKSTLNRDIGIFFSIYYCMTGLHAIHIIAGIGFLSWIFARSLLLHWRSDYFGPVDYVGLYWHLVDLIWIFLFPLLYLID